MSREAHATLLFRRQVSNNLWLSPMFPVLANKKEETPHFRVNVLSQPRWAAGGVSREQLSRRSLHDDEEGGEEEDYRLLKMARLAQLGLVQQEQPWPNYRVLNPQTDPERPNRFRPGGWADFRPLMRKASRHDHALFEPMITVPGVKNEFARYETEFEEFLLPRISPFDPLWEVNRTATGTFLPTNFEVQEDLGCLDKPQDQGRAGAAEAHHPGIYGAERAAHHADIIDIAVIYGRYKCCAHNVGHVLLDEVVSLSRTLEYFGYLDPQKFRISLFLETLQNIRRIAPIKCSRRRTLCLLGAADSLEVVHSINESVE